MDRSGGKDVNGEVESEPSEGSDLSPDELPADELARRLDRDEPLTMLDVRNRTEIERWRIDGSGVTRSEIPYVDFQAARVADGVADLIEDVEFATGGGHDRDRADSGTATDDGRGPVIVVCGRGEASATVADLLIEEGIDARNLAGGMDAWGRVYTATRLDDGDRDDAGLDGTGTGTTVYQYRRPSSGCLSYLVIAGEEAAVIDPLWAFLDRYEADAAAQDASLTRAIDTHVHADHLSAVREFGERGVEAIVPERSAARGVAFDVRTVADGEEITVGDAVLRAVSLPGHTTGMTGFSVGELLLAGDSVSLDGVARPDLEATTTDAGGMTDAGDPIRTEELARRLHGTLTGRLARFEEGTVIVPGHHNETTRPTEDGTYTARLGDLRDRLPAFDLGEGAFVERVLDGLGAPPANHERIVEVNLGAETIDDADARALESGPNNCAAGSTRAD
jgi:glyoxylase-like metal-dependent hydrolase (beta-lactamase superfamily II)/rhodanese-related sulfurtransferase